MRFCDFQPLNDYDKNKNVEIAMGLTATYDVFKLKRIKKFFARLLFNSNI